MSEERSDRFNMGPAIVGQCVYCKHVAAGGPFAVCRAFPSQIPYEILGNDFDHRRPHPDEAEAVRFTPRDGLAPELLAALLARLDELPAPRNGG